MPLPRIRTVATSIALALPAALASADDFSVTYPTPALDRWNYAFNPTPGARITASTFGNEPGSPLFDSRDGQFIVGFNTSAQIPAGLGSLRYTVTSCVLEITYANDFIVEYDPTVDPYTAFLPTTDPEYVDDADAGQPVELYATGFRNGFSLASWAENSPYTVAGQSALNPGVRNAFAMGRNPAGQWVDVSNSVRERWTPTPLAVGTIAGLKPGSLIPVGTPLRFELDVSRADVQDFLRGAVDAGRLRLSVASLTKVVQQGGSFPSFYCRENPIVTATGIGDATLSISVSTSECDTGDLNCDGSVNAQDLAALLGAWGGSGAADLNGDGTVGPQDLAILLGNWN